MRKRIRRLWRMIRWRTTSRVLFLWISWRCRRLKSSFRLLMVGKKVKNSLVEDHLLHLRFLNKSCIEAIIQEGNKELCKNQSLIFLIQYHKVMHILHNPQLNINKKPKILFNKKRNYQLLIRLQLSAKSGKTVTIVKLIIAFISILFRNALTN